MSGREGRVNQRWRYKPNRGYGSFTVVGENTSLDRVTLRSVELGKDKTISLRTLRGDYERIDNIGGAGS